MITVKKFKKILLITGAVLMVGLPIGYLAAETFSLQKQIAELRVSYPKFTDEEIAAVEVVKRSQSSVVSILISKEVVVQGEKLLDLGNGFQMVVPGDLQSKGKQVVGKGSGFAVSDKGLIMTNKHVVADKNADYQVIFNDGTKADAKVAAMDPINDVAILKLNSGLPPNVEPLSFGDSKEIYIGQTAIAIGNALGELSNSVTKGVVSALNRSITAADDAGGQTERLVKIIQTDAAINPGNSGGPLLNTSGEVIGMNTAVDKGAENIGFAIMVDDLRFALKSYEDNGSIVRPFVGIRYALINQEIKKELNLKYSRGALLVEGEKGEPAVLAGSPGQKAGLAEGDIILKINDIAINEDKEPSGIIRNFPIGSKLKVRVWKKSTGKEVTVTVKLAEMK
ncbi:trypsin-like peptidase domain-containing protein [Candidatus Peregrinibacteria bacterium]|nr:trypsin-like peptidase domain-containing protein [Candidatus Peregrinibacteria bacterium]